MEQNTSTKATKENYAITIRDKDGDPNPNIKNLEGYRLLCAIIEQQIEKHTIVDGDNWFIDVIYTRSKPVSNNSIVRINRQGCKNVAPSGLNNLEDELNAAIQTTEDNRVSIPLDSNGNMDVEFVENTYGIHPSIILLAQQYRDAVEETETRLRNGVLEIPETQSITEKARIEIMAQCGHLVQPVDSVNVLAILGLGKPYERQP